MRTFGLERATPMRLHVVQRLAMALGAAALGPAYLGLLAWTAREGPWPRSVARPASFLLLALGLALFVIRIAQLVLRSGGFAESALGLPAAVRRQLRRTVVVLVAAAILLMLPQQLLRLGLIAPGGRPVSAPALSQLFGLAFGLVVWGATAALLHPRLALVAWLTESPERLGRFGRHRRALTALVLAAIGAILLLDSQGFGFTARRWTAAGLQSLVLVGLCLAGYRMIVRAIDHHSWRWVRKSSGYGDAANGGTSEHPSDLAQRLRRLAGLVVPLLGVLLGAWVWNIDLALFRSVSELPFWPLPASSGITVGDVTKALVIFVVTAGAWRHASTFFAVVVFPRMNDDPGLQFAVLTLFRYSLLAVGLLSGLSAVHLGMEKIGVVVAALGVGLGFGLQEIVSNFISGIILLVERPIRVGDIVTVSGMTGRVDRINIRATTIINGDNHCMIVPNRQFITANLVNLTHKDKVVRVTINVGVAYGSDPEQVANLLLSIARDDADVLRNPVPVAFLDSFNYATLNFVLYAHVPDPSLSGRVKHRLYAEIQKRFRDQEIVIPLPTQELHISSLPVEAGGGAAALARMLRPDAPEDRLPPHVVRAPRPHHPAEEEARHGGYDE